MTAQGTNGRRGRGFLRTRDLIPFLLAMVLVAFGISQVVLAFLDGDYPSGAAWLVGVLVIGTATARAVRAARSERDD